MCQDIKGNRQGGEVDVGLAEWQAGIIGVSSHHTTQCAAVVGQPMHELVKSWPPIDSDVAPVSAGWSRQKESLAARPTLGSPVAHTEGCGGNAIIQNYSVIARRLGVTSNGRLVEGLRRNLHIRDGMLTLDAGCGCGGDARQLARKTGAYVVCLDLNSPMLARVPSEMPRIRADVLSMPFTDGCFDRLYAVNLLQLLPERRSFLLEAARVLRWGGLIGLPMTAQEQVAERFMNRFFPSLAAIERRRYPPRDALVEELCAAGFETLRVLPLNLGTFRVDEAYVRRQRTGITSGLSLVGTDERKRGLNALAKAVEQWAARGCYPEVPRRRTLFVAKKVRG